MSELIGATAGTALIAALIAALGVVPWAFVPLAPLSVVLIHALKPRG